MGAVGTTAQAVGGAATHTLQDMSTRFKAFADPTRLRILNLLHERELCVCHLVEVLRESQPKISRHLAILRGAELVTVRSDGTWRWYALPEKSGGLRDTLLASVQTCLRPAEELQADLSRLARLGDRRPCSS
jgi:ArsR family transcriptional regulator